MGGVAAECQIPFTIILATDGYGKFASFLQDASMSRRNCSSLGI